MRSLCGLSQVAVSRSRERPRSAHSHPIDYAVCWTQGLKDLFLILADDEKAIIIRYDELSGMRYEKDWLATIHTCTMYSAHTAELNR